MYPVPIDIMNVIYFNHKVIQILRRLSRRQDRSQTRLGGSVTVNNEAKRP